MSNPCGLFWDIQNVFVPRGSSADSVFTRIRSNIIDKYDLCIKDFHVIGSYNLSKRNIDQLISQGARFQDVGPEVNLDSLMRQRIESFANSQPYGSTIILLARDSLANTLRTVKINRRTKIYLIRYNDRLSERIKEIADRVFLMKRDSLDEIYGDDGGSIKFTEFVSGINNLVESYKQVKAVYSALAPSQDSNGSSTATSSSSSSLACAQSSERFFPGIQSKIFLKITCSINFPPKVISEVRNDLAYYRCSYAIISNGKIWSLFDEISDARFALNLEGLYIYNFFPFEISTSIEKPPPEVINLIVCAKLSKQKLIKTLHGTLIMDKQKVTSSTDLDDDFPRSSMNSSRVAGSSSNNEGCAQS